MRGGNPAWPPVRPHSILGRQAGGWPILSQSLNAQIQHLAESLALHNSADKAFASDRKQEAMSFFLTLLVIGPILFLVGREIWWTWKGVRRDY